MSVPEQPPAPSSPETGHGAIGHIEAWVSEHLTPELATLRSDLAGVAQWAASHAAWAEAMTSLAGKLAELADPAAAPAIQALVAAAERALTEVQQHAGTLTGSRM